ncbi:MAG: TonB-dependent receptor [Polyangiales bacterium]
MRYRGLLFALGVWSWCSITQAQTPPEPPAEPEPSAPEAPTPDTTAPAPELAPETAVTIEAAAEPDPDEPQEMVITGSRIKRSPELAKSAPVQILDRKQIEQNGAANAADLIQTLTAAQGSGYQGGGSPGNQGGGAFGTSSINLRGLGAAATLVLVNGRRLVPSGGGSGDNFADIGLIPLAAIDRIEVLKGGGSAIYGADAVGGVVNIITRPTWDGVRLEADAQATTRADQAEATVSGAFGAKSEHSRVLLSVSYLRRGELRSDKRDFSRDANVDSNGNPATFLAPGLDPANPMRARFVDPACSSVPGSMVVPGIVNNQPTADQICSFNFSRFQSLVGGLERANAFASGSYDLTSHTSLFAELQVSRSRTDLIALPSYSVPPPLAIVPASHIDNPFGRDVAFVGRPLGAAYGPQRTAIGDDTYRIVAGMRGDFEDAFAGTLFESWEWDVTGSWGVSRYSSFVADTLRQPLLDALNSCSDPSDLSRCFNPFYSSVDGTGTPNSQKVIDSFSGTFTNISQHALHTYNAGLSGNLFKLPGGDVGMAFGGELRHEFRQTQLDHDSTEQHYTFYLGNSDAAASRDVISGYVELRWPFFRGVELQTALRVEHYTDIEQTTPSPFAGLTIAPGDIIGGDRVPRWLRRLQVTGQLTSAFRSPSLYQAFPTVTVVPTPIQVPNSALPVYLPVQLLGNPDLRPERALIATAGLTWQPIDELSLLFDFWNYDYRRRIAYDGAQRVVDNDLALMAGGEADPRVTRDPQSGAIQNVRIPYENIPGRVMTNGLDFGITGTLSGKTFGGSVNDFGLLSIGLQGTLTLAYYFPRDLAAPRTIPTSSPRRQLPPLHCDDTECNGVGSRNYNTFVPPLPRWRINVPVTWGYKGHMASVIGRYLSAIENDNAIDQNGNPAILNAMFTIDVQYGYTLRNFIGKELSMRIGLYNLFDRLPPPTRDNNGFEAMLYDPRGRMVYAKLISTF